MWSSRFLLPIFIGLLQFNDDFKRKKMSESEIKINFFISVFNLRYYHSFASGFRLNSPALAPSFGPELCHRSPGFGLQKYVT